MSDISIVNTCEAGVYDLCPSCIASVRKGSLPG
jgi:hypothetical protein